MCISWFGSQLQAQRLAWRSRRSPLFPAIGSRRSILPGAPGSVLRSLGPPLPWLLVVENYIGCWIVALRSVPCPLASGSAQCPRPLAIKNNCVVDCCIAWPLDLGSRCIVWPVSIKILWWIVASLGSLQLRVRPWF